jgi:hypothetical protein
VLGIVAAVVAALIAGVGIWPHRHKPVEYSVDGEMTSEQISGLSAPFADALQLITSISPLFTDVRTISDRFDSLALE